MEDIRKLYEDGVNNSKYLRDKFSKKYNDDHIIELTYDVQSGSYVDALKDKKNRDKKKQYTDEMAKIILEYCPHPKSILKGGTGECVTLKGILQGFKQPVQHVHGFDMCWSRVAYGRQYLKDNGFNDFRLTTGTLTSPPYIENSFEVVTTSHSMEPNGGRETEILQALYKVTGQWLILFEPNYECGNNEVKKRMDDLGYVKDIPQHAKKLGYEVVDHFQLEHYLNDKNPTAVTIIRKQSQVQETPTFACPVTGDVLTHTVDGYYSDKGMCMYPVLDGIPCLKQTNAIIASKYPNFNSIK